MRGSALARGAARCRPSLPRPCARTSAQRRRARGHLVRARPLQGRARAQPRRGALGGPRLGVRAARASGCAGPSIRSSVFDDESGRFERRGSGQYARVLRYWEPSEAQLAEIGGGLEVNSRGSKTKTLRGSGRAGWTLGAARGRRLGVDRHLQRRRGASRARPSCPIFRREDVARRRAHGIARGRARSTRRPEPIPRRRLVRGQLRARRQPQGKLPHAARGRGQGAARPSGNQSERQRDAFMDWMGRRQARPPTR